MTNYATKISGLAMLALAALPIAALSTTAYAAPTAVRIADLDLASVDGARRFEQRASLAARQFCADQRNLRLNIACVAGVRNELSEKFATARQAQIAARSTTFAAR